MKRALLLFAAVAIVGTSALALVPDTTPAPDRATPSSDVAQAPVAVPRPSRDAVAAQRDLSSTADRRERARAQRMGLLEVARSTPWEAHRVAVLAGPFDDRDRRQEMQVTSSLPTLAAIGRAVGEICLQLRDPCRAGDYRFVVRGNSGNTIVLNRSLIFPNPEEHAMATNTTTADPGSKR